MPLRYLKGRLAVAHARDLKYFGLERQAEEFDDAWIVFHDKHGSGRGRCVTRFVRHGALITTTILPSGYHYRRRPRWDGVRPDMAVRRSSAGRGHGRDSREHLMNAQRDRAEDAVKAHDAGDCSVIEEFRTNG